MADQAAQAAPGAPADAGGGGIFSNPLVRQIVQGFAVWQIVSLVTKGLGGGKTATPAVPSPDLNHPGGAAPSTVQPVQQRGQQPQAPPVIPVWAPKSLLDVQLRLSPEEDPLAVDLEDSSFPSITWEGVEWSNTKWGKVWEIEWDVPEAVQHNASFYLDVFVTRSGHSPIPSHPTYPSSGEVLHVRKPLTRYAPQKRARAVKNLLSGKPASPEEEEKEEEETEQEKKDRPIVSYYHPNVTLELVCDSGNIPYANLPPPVKQHVHIARNGEKTFDGKQAYFPPVWPNDFWLMKGSLQPVNTSTTRLPLRVDFHPTSNFKFQALSSLDDAFNKQSQATGGGGGELDEIKRMLTETNPLLLITTAVVSVLHMLFEFLAFTADIKHWRGKKELVGVSLRTILTNVFVQTIVLLYLIDQSEETNYMILMSSGIGVLIEAWKITKAVDISLIPLPSRPLFPYKLSIKDKHVLSEDEKKTQEFDKLAFKWVAWGTTPFLLGWTVYSVMYQSHRSWYSFTIQTLTSFVQMFGFVQLVPQLIINWKLKSVAHIPMKAMGYKVLSTVIDDFFSFIIKMPLLHRLACFRDDVVFLILLYQMWIYKVDPTRENEYGQKLSDEEAKAILDKQAKAKQEEVKASGKETKKTHTPRPPPCLVASLAIRATSALLKELQASNQEVKPVIEQSNLGEKLEKVSFIDNEPAFRWSLLQDGMAFTKLHEGIKKFAEDAEELKSLLKAKLQ
ncbi:hypothetical protein JCM10213_003992 [Rhodosporidiobolus nylandii]